MHMLTKCTVKGAKSPIKKFHHVALRGGISFRLLKVNWMIKWYDISGATLYIFCSICYSQTLRNFCKRHPTFLRFDLLLTDIRNFCKLHPVYIRFDLLLTDIT